MKNYKINIDRPIISKEEISSRSDFDLVLKNYHATVKPFYKSGGFVAGTSIVAVVMMVSIYMLQPGKSDQDRQVNKDAAETALPLATEETLDHPFVQPPLENLDIPFVKYSVIAEKGDKLEYGKTGSMIIIPAGLFVDGSGKVVKGEVEIRYREFHDAVDFFVSGIPMEYDSAGKKYIFESAGMLDIQAYQAGKQVFIAPGKKVDVQMASQQSGTYNVYNLDTQNKNWTYKSRNSAQKGSAPQKRRLNASNNNTGVQAETPELVKVKNELTVIRQEITTLVDAKPILPRRANKVPYRFNIEVDASEFPELAIYKGIQFEVTEDNKNFTSKNFDITWESATLSEIEKGVKYNLELVKGSSKLNVMVLPVLDGINYDQAAMDYEKKFKEYETTLDAKKKEEKQKQAEYDQLLKKMRLEMQAMQKNAEEAQKKQALVDRNVGNVMRAFSIDRFGIWNCDNPSVYPVGNSLDAKFEGPENNILPYRVLYHVEKDRNALFYVYKSNTSANATLRYNPDATNMLFGVLTDGRLVLYTYADFENVPRSKGDYTFKMHVIDKQFNTVEEIKDYLKI